MYKEFKKDLYAIYIESDENKIKIYLVKRFWENYGNCWRDVYVINNNNTITKYAECFDFARSGLGLTGSTEVGKKKYNKEFIENIKENIENAESFFEALDAIRLFDKKNLYDIYNNKADDIITECVWILTYPDNENEKEIYDEKRIKELEEYWSIKIEPTGHSRDCGFGKEEEFVVTGERWAIECMKEQLEQA